MSLPRLHHDRLCPDGQTSALNRIRSEPVRETTTRRTRISVDVTQHNSRRREFKRRQRDARKAKLRSLNTSCERRVAVTRTGSHEHAACRSFATRHWFAKPMPDSRSRGNGPSGFHPSDSRSCSFPGRRSSFCGVRPPEKCGHATLRAAATPSIALAIGIGERGFVPRFPSHTTGQAGPHPAVRWFQGPARRGTPSRSK